MKSLIILSTLLIYGNTVEINTKLNTLVKSTLKTTCVAGYYINGSVCTKCSKGQYSKTADVVACTKCEKGYWNSVEGSTTCALSLAGNKAVGYDLNFTGATLSQGCGYNKYSAAGATICSWCETGKYSILPSVYHGPTACIDCEAGKYGLGVALGCATCAAGYYSNSGASSCTKCDVGAFSSAGASACQRCPAAHTTNDVGSIGAESCINCATSLCTVNENQYLGCYNDDNLRDMQTFKGDVDSLESCQLKCVGYSYFAIQTDDEFFKCFCWNAYATDSKYNLVDNASCKVVNKPLYWGGRYKNAVYRNINYGPENVPVITTINYDLPAAVSVVEASQYLGCYSDDPYRDVKHYSGMATTDVAQCQDKCNGYNYFALQNGKQCFCNNAYGTSQDFFLVSNNECSEMNAGKPLYWGGFYRNAVYRHKNYDEKRSVH